MTIRELALAGTVALMLAGGQLLFKQAAIAPDAKNTLDIFLSVRFLLAILLYGLSTVLWVIVLQTAPISKAYPIVMIGSALIPIAAYFLFREPITVRYLVGFAIILFGLYLTVSTTGK